MEMQTTVLEMPTRPDSFNRGQRDAKGAVAAGVSFDVAYTDALIDSLSYENETDYLRGFVSTYISE